MFWTRTHCLKHCLWKRNTCQHLQVQSSLNVIVVVAVWSVVATVGSRCRRRRRRCGYRCRYGGVSLLIFSSAQPNGRFPVFFFYNFPITYKDKCLYRPFEFSMRFIFIFFIRLIWVLSQFRHHIIHMEYAHTHTHIHTVQNR